MDCNLQDLRELHHLTLQQLSEQKDPVKIAYKIWFISKVVMKTISLLVMKSAKSMHAFCKPRDYTILFQPVYDSRKFLS